MFSPRVRTALIGAIGCLALGGCASYYNPYGYGYGARYGYGYGGYGYPGGVSIGYGTGGYYSPYYGSRYGYGNPYGYGYSGYPYGWYNGFYYPGRGIYVYDRRNRPHRWDQAQRRYWENRRSEWQQRNRTQVRRVIVQERRDGWRDGRGDRRRVQDR